MSDYTKIFATYGIGIATIRYILYFRDIRRGTAKPHVFSWFVGGVLSAIAAGARFAKGAGAGAWITGFVASACLTISMIALSQGEKDITRSDWVCFVTALLATVLWVITHNPLSAVLVVTAADGLGYVPTFRKSYHDPWSEPPNGYALATLRGVFGVLSLASFNLTTVFYPAVVMLLDGSFTIMLLIRRRQLNGSYKPNQV